MCHSNAKHAVTVSSPATHTHKEQPEPVRTLTNKAAQRRQKGERKGKNKKEEDRKPSDISLIGKEQRAIMEELIITKRMKEEMRLLLKRDGDGNRGRYGQSNDETEKKSRS